MENNGILKLVFLLLITSVLSCTDHLMPENLRVKTITQTLPVSNGISNVTTFYYDDAGRLSYLKSYQTPDSNAAPRTRTIFTYDGNNMLATATRNFSDLKTEKYQFTYGQTGQVSKLDYAGATDDFYNMTFSYNGNQPAGSVRKFNFSSVSFEKDISYQFSGNNLGTSSAVTTIVKNIPSVANSESSYSFDDKVNPFYGNFIIPAPNGPAQPSQGNFNYYTYYGGVDNLLPLNRNNILSATAGDGSSTTYEYTYNSQGLPLSRITKKKNSSQGESVIDETLVYTYETY